MLRQRDRTRGDMCSVIWFWQIWKCKAECHQRIVASGRYERQRWLRWARCREQNGLGQGQTPGAHQMLFQKVESMRHRSSPTDVGCASMRRRVPSPVRPKQEDRRLFIYYIFF